MLLSDSLLAVQATSQDLGSCPWQVRPVLSEINRFQQKHHLLFSKVPRQMNMFAHNLAVQARSSSPSFASSSVVSLSCSNQTHVAPCKVCSSVASCSGSALPLVSVHCL
ncbi:unnamed protein product [Urochloa humidicola]